MFSIFNVGGKTTASKNLTFSIVRGTGTGSSPSSASEAKQIWGPYDLHLVALSTPSQARQTRQVASKDRKLLKSMNWSSSVLEITYFQMK